MSSLWKDASAIGGFVNGRVLSLQRRYLAGGASTASVRAVLARLRSLGTPGQSAWAIVGGELFSGMPELGLSARDESRMIRAVAGAMNLYARHQQGGETGVAIAPQEGGKVARPHSFGWSCRMIEQNLEDAEGVRRRMQGIEAASDFDGTMFYARGLVDLMRSKGVRADYGLLAHDLYLVQFEGVRDQVFVTWSRDYYTTKAPAETEALAAPDSTSSDKE